ncbi:MAG: glycosyltransferase family 4 protein [Chloroflexota bacterium]
MAEPLSFCMVTTFYPPYHFGGDAMYVYRLSNLLARRGHRVTVVHCVDAYRMLSSEEPADHYPNHPNVRVERLRSPRGRLSPLVTYLTGRPGLKAPALDAIFDGERFDVVHFHNVSLVGGPGILRYGDGIKLYTLHEHWLVCPMHVLWKYNREPCVKPECLRCTLAFHRPPQLWRYTNLLANESRRVDLFLAPSRFTMDQHRARGFDRPMRYLPHFLPVADLDDAANSVEPGPPTTGRPYFLFVGRLTRLKGVQTLLDVFRQFDAADLLVAGHGDHADELRRQAADLPHVRFLGHRHPDELRRLYAGATALIVPSSGYEVFGLVVLEAFAQRTPVIVRDLGALPEPVRESGAGFTYQTADELLAAMRALTANPRLRQELGERGYRAHRDHWSDDAHLDGYFDAIREAGERRRSRLAAGDPAR